MQKLLIISTLLISYLAEGQSQIPKQLEKFPVDTVKKRIDYITRELSLNHPGFYRYNSKEQFKVFIDSIKNSITDSLTLFDSYLKIKPIISKIGCLHTGISFPKDYTKELNQKPNLIPLQLYISRNKVFVVKNFTDNKLISPGDEIKTINGQRIEVIISKLLPFIPSDGYNLTMKYKALYYQFPLWYRFLNPAEDFTITVNKNGIERDFKIKGKKFSDIAEDGFLKEPLLPKQLEFTINDSIGILTIHSFSKSAIKKAHQNFKPFIDDVFKKIKYKGITNLVINLRDNTGGSDSYAAYFTRYFFHKPFRYWDRIEVTESIAKQIKGAVKLFYRKPIQRDSIWLWQKARYVNEFNFYEVQKPAKSSFNGQAYILINGFCMSSCADVAAILSHNKKATFIGQETGGGYQGNTSGMMPQMKVDGFDFAITVPLQKYYNHVDTLNNVGMGTLPDYLIESTVTEILERKDKELAFTLHLIKARYQ